VEGFNFGVKGLILMNALQRGARKLMERYYMLCELQQLVGDVKKFQACLRIVTRHIHNLAANYVSEKRGILENQL
jgi:hypothetical protein